MLPRTPNGAFIRPQVHMELADLMHRAGRRSEVGPAFRQGEILFERLITDRPTLAGPRFELARYLADFPDTRLRDTGRAIELAEKAVELAPNEADALVKLGLARYRTGDWRSTIRAMQKALESRPGATAQPGSFWPWLTGNWESRIKPASGTTGPSGGWRRTNHRMRVCYGSATRQRPCWAWPTCPPTCSPGREWPRDEPSAEDATDRPDEPEKPRRRGLNQLAAGSKATGGTAARSGRPASLAVPRALGLRTGGKSSRT